MLSSLPTVIVDGIEIRRKDKIFFCYLYGTDRPYIHDYLGVVNDFFYTYDGEVFLDVEISRMDGKLYVGPGQIFRASFLIKDTLTKGDDDE